jgi:hypothetical protein
LQNPAQKHAGDTLCSTNGTFFSIYSDGEAIRGIIGFAAPVGNSSGDSLLQTTNNPQFKSFMQVSCVGNLACCWVVIRTHQNAAL